MLNAVKGLFCDMHDSLIDPSFLRMTCFPCVIAVRNDEAIANHACSLCKICDCRAALAMTYVFIIAIQTQLFYRQNPSTHRLVKAANQFYIGVFCATLYLYIIKQTVNFKHY
jgi:hypothetical protein